MTYNSLSVSATVPSSNIYTDVTLAVRVSDVTATYIEAGDDYVAQFAVLVKKWRSQTYYSSTVDERISHPSFETIVAMGEKAVPLIIDELEQYPDFLVMALPIITGEDPVQNSDRGKLSAIVESWIQWYNRHSRT